MAEENTPRQPNFEPFLNWASTKTQGQPDTGDMLSRLSELWKDWLADHEEADQFPVRLYEKLRHDEAAQREFLSWLGAQPEFAGGRDRLAPYQLVQCDGFKYWTELGKYKSSRNEYGKDSVYAGLVRKSPGQAESSARAVKLAVVLIPRPTDQTPVAQVKVWPLNFEADNAAKEALATSGQAIHHLLRIGIGVRLLSGYLLGVAWLHTSIPYGLKAIGIWRRLRHRLLRNDCYVLIDVETGAIVEGGSLGLSSSLALLLAAVKTCIDDGKSSSAIAYAEFVEHIFPRLAKSGFTGAIHRDGGVGRVDEDGIEKKLIAIKKKGLKFGVLPEENILERQKEGMSREETVLALQSEFSLDGLELCGVTSLEQVLRWLMGLRLATALKNGLLVAALVAAVFVSLWRGPDFYDRHFRPPPDLQSVEVPNLDPEKKLYLQNISTGDVKICFSLDYVRKEDIPVHQIARITLHIGHPRNDGRTLVQVSAEERFGQGVRFECLQTPEDKQRGDWHPEVTLSVLDGKAVFDYQERSRPCPNDQQQENQIIREHFTVKIERNGRTIQTYPLTLIVK